jgi:anaerobic magnesium-protoporphyrin IX monomethyl ester cyclase
MTTMLINPPYQTITSNWGVGHQVPLGLLMVGGAARDAGHQVSLLDAEAMRMSCAQVAEQVRRAEPAVVMSGHAGGTPAHPVCVEMFEAIKRVRPETICVYGGVFPTYHDEYVLSRHSAVDIVVRGEGEAIASPLLRALEEGRQLAEVDGSPTARRVASRVRRTAPRSATWTSTGLAGS